MYRHFSQKYLLTFPVLLALLMLATSAPQATKASGPAEVVLVETQEQGVTLELEVPTYYVTPSTRGAYQTVVAPGLEGQTGSPGEARLPATSTLVAVPPEAKISLEILEDQPSLVQQNITLEPVPQEEPVLAPAYANDPEALNKLADPVTAYAGTRKVFTPSTQEALTRAATMYQPVYLAETGYLRDQRFVRVIFQPFEYRADRSLYVHERLRVKLRFQTDRTLAPATPRPDPYFESTLRRAFINYEQGRAWRQAPSPIQSASGAATSAQRLRIHVDQDGLYVITYQDLVDAGVNFAKLDARTLRMTSRGEEVAIWVTGEEDGRFDAGDKIIFFGERSHSRTSYERVYWLTWGDAQGARMNTRDVNPAQGGAPVSSYMASQHFEENTIYISSLPANGEADRWYWQRYNVGSRPSIPNITLDAPLSDPLPDGQAELRVTIQGSSNWYNISPDHRVNFYINDTQVGSGEWDGQTELSSSIPFSSSLLQDGNNLVRITATNDTGASNDSSFLNWFEISYPRSLIALNDRLIFEHAYQGRASFQVEGFSTPDLLSFDITNPNQPIKLVQGVSQGAGPYSFLFSDTGNGVGRYLIWPESALLTPLRVVADSPSNLKSSGNRADYLIITHADFLDAIEPLAQYRRSQGYEVLVIDVQDIYNEFAYGEFSPQAIRDFIDYAYHQWQAPAPAYVLLVGDGTYDYLNYLQAERRNYIPPFLEVVDPFIKETATDNRLVTVSGSDILPDLFIGRFPANSAAEVTNLVNKTINYETMPWPGDWLLRNLFIADNADVAGDFAALSDQVADNILPPLYDAQKQKIYLGINVDSAVDARNAINQALNEGAFISNYIGHGQVQHWASEFLFRAEDAAALTNGGRLPIHLSMTCLDGRFHEAESDALAEELVRNTNGGAIAVWAATGLGVAHGHDYLHQGFYRALFEDGERVLGPLTTAGKVMLYTGDSRGIFHDLIDTFGLLGDPALRLGLATNDVSITLEEAPSTPLTQGDSFTLRFLLQNAGQMEAPDTTVAVTLPPLQSLLASSELGPVQITLTDPVTFTLGTLAAGQSAELTITGTLPAALSQNRYLITATVTSSWQDSNPDNNESLPQWLEIAAADAYIRLASGNTRALGAGDAFNLQVKFANTGVGDATGVTITVPLPSGIENVIWTATDQALTLQSTYPWVFNLPSLPANAAASIQLSGTAGDTILRSEIQAALHSDWPDSNLNNNVSDPLLIVIAGTDSAEPNDSSSQATPLPIPGHLPELSYQQAGDQDWFMFTAQPGRSYHFYTDRLTEAGDTLLVLYAASGQEIARADQAGASASLLWRASQAGTYYLMVTRPDGADTPFLYDLHSSFGQRHFLPLLLNKR